MATLDGIPIIDESNYRSYVSEIETEGFGTGYIPRDYDAMPEGSLGFADPFDLPVIPRDQWAERIKAREVSHSRISDWQRRKKVKVNSQGQTSFCWAHGTVKAMELSYAMSGHDYTELAPESIAAPIKGFRSQGGNTPEAIRWLSAKGCCERQYWPRNSYSRSNYTDQVKQNAMLWRLSEWLELSRNRFDQLATCLLLGLPAGIGLKWWRHLVCAMDLVKTGANSYGVMILNSWGPGWGDNGRGILEESKAKAFDQYACRTGTLRGLAA